MKKVEMINFIWKSILGGIGCWILLSACGESDAVGAAGGPAGPVDTADRVVLIYMAGDNSLSSDGNNNIQLMLKGMQNVAGRLVIYFDPANDVPHLMTIVNEKDTVVLDTLKTYTEENSASKEVLGRVIGETRELYPSNSFGLILWSHGMAWLPQNYSFPGAYMLQNSKRLGAPRTKYFGEDQHKGEYGGGGFMEIKELAEALPGGISFILFDACFMSSIEVIYELRLKTEYVLASPAEVIADGFPYDKILKYMWGGEEELIQVCSAFFDYYNTHPEGGDWRSATVAMVRTSEIGGVLEIAREVLNGRNDFQARDFSEVWRYPLSSSRLPSVFYDLGQYIKEVASEEQYARFRTQLERAVVYKKATEKFFGKSIPKDKFSGISTYIPLNQWTSMNTYYKTFTWPRAVY